MLLVKDLNIGSIDAINYTQRQEREFLNKIFFRDEYLDQVLERKRYFLVGEKGTGKTAYASLLNNTVYSNTSSTLKSITETDYRKFLRLKENSLLKISDYNDVWKTILLLLTSSHLEEKEGGTLRGFTKFSKLKEAVDEYYNGAFSPEVIYALDFVENFERSASLISKYAGAEVKKETQETHTEKNFQLNLMYIQRRFEDAISSLKLKRDHIIFIDGIDIRPHLVLYDDYIECIRGLALAAWELNTDYFSNIRDSKGRIKIVILLRPDIFGSLGYQNRNAKLRDNSVLLDWRTTYGNYRGSRIFQLADGILRKQQEKPEKLALGDAWDHYFPYTVPNMVIAEREDNPFIGFLRYSLYRPRDIVSYLLIMQEHVAYHQANQSSFENKTFVDCQSAYSDYLLGEIQDQVEFYYTNANFEDVTMFFSFLGGKSIFNYDEYTKIYPKYREIVQRRDNPIREILEGPEEFLQFLYSSNIIGYREKTDIGYFVHWCFRDRTATKLNPTVRFGLEYNIHPGLSRALQVGRVRPIR